MVRCDRFAKGPEGSFKDGWTSVGPQCSNFEASEMLINKDNRLFREQDAELQR